MMSPLSAPSSSDSAQADAADYVLGQTGETVVYIFPTGHALMTREVANDTAALAEYKPYSATFTPPNAATPEAPCPPPSLENLAWVDQRLAAGTLTQAQVEVARYDQSVTGLSLTEALALRGWL